ncbi:MAG: hypothetical protein AVDCRST_MAG68-3180 [uncultured Gemmatimonadetes bacterium]|uniref:Uncharacterized protein n=1 Tax=uncultured Gemmatimonadota bacterium TaxID=203437 RepID=A0A6J4LYY7_9BACT|nr:MAG: hypothetical protein AVDCRST_MAG68-3180 [uncultured Gemmatimonadota bacterium]
MACHHSMPVHSERLEAHTEAQSIDNRSSRYRFPVHHPRG